ncbi:hypothetical protein P9112_007955 [Eukaryota sp. TZLM1-RC]
MKLFALSFLACLLATALANSHGLTVQGDTDISTCHNARFSARGNLERGSVVWSASNQLIDSLINRRGLSFLKSLSTIQKEDGNPIELLLQAVDEDCSASPEGCPSMMLLTVKDIRHFVATFYESDVNDIKSLIEFLPASLPSLFKDTFATTAIEFVTSIEPELLTATVDNIISVLDDSALDRILSISGLKLLKEETYLFQWKILNCIPAENVVATFIHLQESKVKIIDTMSILFKGVYCHSINYEGVVDLIEPLTKFLSKEVEKENLEDFLYRFNEDLATYVNNAFGDVEIGLFSVSHILSALNEFSSPGDLTGVERIVNVADALFADTDLYFLSSVLRSFLSGYDELNEVLDAKRLMDTLFSLPESGVSVAMDILNQLSVIMDSEQQLLFTSWVQLFEVLYSVPHDSQSRTIVTMGTAVVDLAYTRDFEAFYDTLETIKPLFDGVIISDVAIVETLEDLAVNYATHVAILTFIEVSSQIEGYNLNQLLGNLFAPTDRPGYTSEAQYLVSVAENSRGFESWTERLQVFYKTLSLYFSSSLPYVYENRDVLVDEKCYNDYEKINADFPDHCFPNDGPGECCFFEPFVENALLSRILNDALDRFQEEAKSASNEHVASLTNLISTIVHLNDKATNNDISYCKNPEPMLAVMKALDEAYLIKNLMNFTNVGYWIKDFACFEYSETVCEFSYFPTRLVNLLPERFAPFVRFWNEAHTSICNNENEIFQIFHNFVGITLFFMDCMYSASPSSCFELKSPDLKVHVADPLREVEFPLIPDAVETLIDLGNFFLKEPEAQKGFCARIDEFETIIHRLFGKESSIINFALDQSRTACTYLAYVAMIEEFTNTFTSSILPKCIDSTEPLLCVISGVIQELIDSQTSLSDSPIPFLQTVADSIDIFLNELVPVFSNWEESGSGLDVLLADIKPIVEKIFKEYGGFGDRIIYIFNRLADFVIIYEPKVYEILEVIQPTINQCIDSESPDIVACVVVSLPKNKALQVLDILIDVPYISVANFFAKLKEFYVDVLPVILDVDDSCELAKALLEADLALLLPKDTVHGSLIRIFL